MVGWFFVGLFRLLLLFWRRIVLFFVQNTVCVTMHGHDVQQTASMRVLHHAIDFMFNILRFKVKTPVVFTLLFVSFLQRTVTEFILMLFETLTLPTLMIMLHCHPLHLSMKGYHYRD